MTDMTEAIQNRLTARQAEAEERRRGEFQVDPDLERQAALLDGLRENDPAQHQAPGLARLRQQVTLYRRRKAEHDDKETNR